MNEQNSSKTNNNPNQKVDIQKVTKWIHQKELLEKCIKAGVNIVTCGDCGKVLLVKTNEEEHSCPHCGFESDICDFPDLYY